ncbi:hypothetical protein ACSVDE_10345 [Pseudalkalibacillus sp. Hm43]|uniref:hypothetical protein n=1 Tax=Pseudalkalibacillus sp. Hm43 TaxID=3450742 RepID=UPI003F43526B
MKKAVGICLFVTTIVFLPLSLGHHEAHDGIIKDSPSHMAHDGIIKDSPPNFAHDGIIKDSIGA